MTVFNLLFLAEYVLKVIFDITGDSGIGKLANEIPAARSRLMEVAGTKLTKAQHERLKLGWGWPSGGS